MTCPNSNQYENNGKCCNLCPPGEYVLSHCSSSSSATCKTCPHDTYTAQNNRLDHCISCRQCHEDQRELEPCKKNSDRQCKCDEGFYCSGGSTGHCEHCLSVTTCLPGEGVSKKPTSSTDTICKPCTPGTFSNVTDYTSPCHSHTNCEKLGRHLLTAGTNTTDAVCGDFITNCHWLLPASLWVGLIMTILICGVLALLYRRAKRKSQQTVIISPCTESFVPPAFPPDIIKHPGSPELQTLFHKDEMLSCSDNSSECKDITMTTMTASEKYGHSADWPQCGPFFPTDSSVLQSEPQEDEWPGV